MVNGIAPTMNDIFIPIDKAGRVVLPKEIRDELSISAGDLLEVRVRGDEVSLRPKHRGSGLQRRGKALVFVSGEGTLLKEASVQRVIDEARNERDPALRGSHRSK
jgi:AbrB family looped-hinge helix DNA binding protein